ncbi:restriction endonuclease, SacI family [Streptomyces sp. WAC08401]|nr:restriction endonuclease, SacI family [Streptomyces sp. WAC08401]
MAVRFDPHIARQTLDESFRQAMEATSLPEAWLHLSRSLRQEEAPHTYTPALGTALLARTLDETVDPRSIKQQTHNARSYSARTLCHRILVPASVELARAAVRGAKAVEASPPARVTIVRARTWSRAHQRVRATKTAGRR